MTVNNDSVSVREGSADGYSLVHYLFCQVVDDSGQSLGNQFSVAAELFQIHVRPTIKITQANAHANYLSQIQQNTELFFGQIRNDEEERRMGVGG